MGVAGDMLMAALYELLPENDRSLFRAKMEQLGLPGVAIEYLPSTKCGITGTHVAVKVGGALEKSEDVFSHGHNGHDHHQHGFDHGGHQHHGAFGRRYGYDEILSLICGLPLPENVRENALGVYDIIGKAEAAVHGVSLDEIHLHEIGSMDAVADIVGCCLLVDMLCLEEITASAVHVGSGHIRCEHGILPVPAPAAAEILKGIPIYGGRIKGELCTPTGAALLKRFAQSFGEMPHMVLERIGYGMGAKDFEMANCLRAFLYESAAPGDGGGDVIYEISCNLDDMTPEAIGAAIELLFDSGALDVFTTPIMMKKNRPAVLLTCLAPEGGRVRLARLMLTHTSSLGVRITKVSREILSRSNYTVSTEYGEICVKYAQGFGVRKWKPEYDDVLDAAKRHGVPFWTVHEAALKKRRESNEND